jgi:hypothetical protein
VKIDQRRPFASARRYDAPDEETVRANSLVTMQHALQCADCRAQQRDAEEALIPGANFETIGALGAIATGETQGEVLLSAAEKTHAETAAAKNSVVRFGARIDADQEARRIHTKGRD